MLNKLIAAVRNPASLGERVLNASLWQVAAAGVQYPLRLASNLILTRLLLPEAFGMMAVIMVLHVGLHLFTDIGVTQSVMRDARGAEPRYLRVAWLVQILRGLAIWVLLLLLGLLVMIFGPAWAGPDTVYADPVLPWLIWFSSISLLCKAFESANVLLAMREMRQKLVVSTEIAEQITALFLMIPLAWYTGSVWALAAGPVAASVLRLVLSHTVFPGPRMGLVWDRTQASEMWTYGRWLLASSVGGFLISFSDRLILGALVDKHVLGIYSIALVWIEMGQNLLQKIGNSTLVPALSQTLREAPERVRAVLARFTRAFEAMVLVMIAGVLLTADLIFGYLYEDTYADAAFYARLIAFKLMWWLSVPNRHFVVASGNSRHFAIAQLLGGALFVAGFYVGFELYRVEGAILFSVLGALVIPLVICFEGRLVREIPLGRELAKLALCAVVIVAVLVGLEIPEVRRLFEMG
jgi:O-antigen/teichoic acid export membrane protein